jgi:ribonuclease D
MDNLPMESENNDVPLLSISKEEINALPPCAYEGRIDFVRSPEELDASLAALAGHTLIGFDTETRPAFRRGESYPPSLVQLASDDVVVVVQLRALGGEIGPLRDLLSHGGVTKAGIAPRDDVRKLRDLFHFEPAGFHDLSDLARRRGYKQTGLRALAAMVLGVRVSKSEQVSNWARRDLSEAQVRYAATDAWMTRRLFARLSEPA